MRDSVSLGNAGKALHRGAIETNALFKGALELSRCDGNGLQIPQNVGKPQADITDILLFDCAEDEFLLTVHTFQRYPGARIRGTHFDHPAWLANCRTRAITAALVASNCG